MVLVGAFPPVLVATRTIETRDGQSGDRRQRYRWGGVQAGEPDRARTRARRRRMMTIAGNDDAETLPRLCRNLGQSEGCLTRVV